MNAKVSEIRFMTKCFDSSLQQRLGDLMQLFYTHLLFMNLPVYQLKINEISNNSSFLVTNLTKLNLRYRFTEIYVKLV